jgi:serine/threonine protein kinase/tetratricopeptide (TPR) repeat protein
MKLRLPLDLDRWQRVEGILDQALELPSGEQSSFLEQACSGDPGLRAEVEALLSADEAAGGFLSVPAGEYAPDLLLDEVDGEESEEDLAGHQLGPYRLLREVGGGGMGTVYEAEDARLGRRVAVKLLPPEYSRDRKAKERFLREARTAAGVDHPNLCTVHDVGESDGRLYIVLSFYEGETLRERIRRGPLPIAEARVLAIQVARGLTRAHEAGIVHRDIKPANVMLTRRGEAKILDFGIARLQGDEASLTRTGASWGTPAYMSPEQARGTPVDARTDIWSLGVMLYEMIAGRRPFGGESMEAVLSAILTQKPEPLENIRDDVPEGLARVVDRALAKDPKERYSIAAEFLTDLESGSMSVRRSWPERLRVSLLIGATAVVLLVSGLLWWLSHSAAAPPIKVAVLQPKVTSQNHDPELDSIASEVVEAALASLITLEGVQALDPPDRDEKSDSPTERLRAAEADEALIPLLDCQGGWCRVRLRREKPKGEVLATIGPFEAQTGIENAYALADAMRVNVKQIYSDRSSRPGSPGINVRPEDYSVYVALERRVENGETLGRQELARLDSLLRTSPDLIEAYALAAGIARNQGGLDRALSYAARAEKIAPNDPRPLFSRLRIEVRQNRLDAARETLDRLSGLVPGDARALRAKAELLAASGDLEQAHRLWQTVVQRRPTWRNVLELASLELGLGAHEETWRHLRDLLATYPNNQYILEELAAYEATFGDFKKAAALYERQIRIQPKLSALTSLGFIQYLLGDYPAAAGAYRRALALEPGHLVARFNLATSLEAQGSLGEARRFYRTIAKELAALPTPPDTHTRLLNAQCLLRLGQRKDAARLTKEVLKQIPDDVHNLYQAAQLYALLGDHYSASYYIKLSLEQGMRREWFSIPEFKSLQGDPGFRALLEGQTVLKPAS